MKIITWNCNMAFRKKAGIILKHKPDILIVPECEHPDKWKAIHHYDRHFINQPVILAGDFNSNTIWDRKYREGNHSSVVKRLAEKGIFSTYHRYYKQEQGKEKHPTLYMYRHKDKPYHIDYCFASADLSDKLRSVEIGRHKFWTQYSDHVPVMVTIG